MIDIQLNQEEKSKLDNIKSKIIFNELEETYTINIKGIDYIFKIITMEELVGCYNLASKTKIPEDIMLVAKSLKNFKDDEVFEFKESLLNFLELCMYHIYDMGTEVLIKPNDKYFNVMVKDVEYTIKELTALESRNVDSKYGKLLKSIVSPKFTEEEFGQLKADIGIKLQFAIRKIVEMPDFF